MSKLLAGRTIVLTGASGGIGQASARIFVREGADVVLADRDESTGIAFEKELADQGARVRFIPVNVADEASVRGMIDFTLSEFGKIDGAFNNAGVGFAGKPLHELDKADFQRAIDINLTGVFLCMKYEITEMLKLGRGAIVNTGSVASIIALPNSVEYTGSKHGVLGLTRNAAVDYSRHGIRVNALLVGPTLTPLLKRTLPDWETNTDIVDQMTLIKRMAGPEEIGEAAAWLLSDRSSFIAGTGLSIDGGYTVV